MGRLTITQHSKENSNMDLENWMISRVYEPKGNTDGLGSLCTYWMSNIAHLYTKEGIPFVFLENFPFFQLSLVSGLLVFSY